jgi:putative hemolysin
MEKRTVIDIHDMEKWSFLFRGKVGHQLSKRVTQLFAMDKINAVYDHSFAFKGAEFASSLLNELGVLYEVGNAERLRLLPEGAFITISNHPYGGLDGIMLVDLMASIRSDYKLMVNKMLALVKTMDENFITVTPTTTKKLEPTTNLNGIRETIAHLKEGHPMGFFPAGAVSEFSFRHFGVRDRDWQESILKLIQKAKVPIVPIRFFDKNSPLFYFLGVIDWRIRLIRLPHEVFNKELKQTRIGIGETISVEEQKPFKDIHTFSDFLRKKVYEMPEPVLFTLRRGMDLPTKDK